MDAATPGSAAALVRDADRDRWLATLYAPAAMRPALLAVHALDLELAKVAATTTDAMLGEIRLAWWRERLLALDVEVPAQPVLRALAADVLPRGISGAMLARFEDSWLALADGDVAGFVAARGAAVGGVIARLLGGDEAGVDLGRRWAAGEAARSGYIVDPLPVVRAPAALRSLAGLATLGARDLARAVAGLPTEARATPKRQLLLLCTMLTGR